MCIIAMKTATAAARARSALERGRISVEIVSIDPSLTKRGCGYGICLRESEADAAEAILRERRIEFGTRLGDRAAGGNA